MKIKYIISSGGYNLGTIISDNYFKALNQARKQYHRYVTVRAVYDNNLNLKIV